MPIYFDDESIYLKHIWTSVVRGYSAIKDGILANYTSYLRLEDAFAEDATEQIIRVGRDVPPYEFVDTPEMGLERRHRQYEGTNLCEANGEPDGDLTGVSCGSYITDDPFFGNCIEVTNDTCFVDGLLDNIGVYSLSLLAYKVSGTGTPVLGPSNATSTTPITSTPEFVYLTGFSNTAINNKLTIFAGIVGVTVRFKLFQVTKTAHQLPTIPSSKDGPVTVNKGLITMPIEAIDTACILANGTSDRVTLDNSVILGTSDFIFEGKFRITNLSSINGLIGEQENGALVMQVSTGGNIQIIEPGVAVVHTSTLSVSANETVNLKYKRIFSGVSILTVNGTSENVTDNQNYDGRIGLLLSRLVGSYFNGYVWDFSLSINAVPSFHYTFADYREDGFIKDISPAGNHALLSANINTVLNENLGFGYPVNQEERKPFDATTDDGVDFKYGAKGVLQGIAKGEENSVNYNFDLLTGWAVTDGWTYGVGEAICDGTQIGTTRITQLFDFEDGSRYEMCAKPNSFDAGFLRFSTGGRAFDWNDATGGTGIMSVRFNAVASDTNIRLEGNVGAIANIDFFSCRKVSPAVGHINFEEYMFAGFPAVGNIDLITKEDGTPFLYIDSTDGLLKGFDGVNTCVSNTAMVPFTYYSFFLYLNGFQFWVTLDTDKGAEVAFTGSIDDLGNRLRIMPTGTYQTVEDIIIGDSLNFYYIVQNDVYIVQNGTTIIQYS